MELQAIKELIAAVDKSSITKFKFESDDFKLKLEKEQANVAHAVVQSVNPVEADVLTTVTEVPVQNVVKTEVAKSAIDVVAPLVGVFYEASGPGIEPFVKVGQSVNEGDTVCILEAMKVLNEIKAPATGVVTQIYVANGDVVEFGQVLMEIDDTSSAV